MRGTFLSEKEAENKALELGCKGIHKNKDKWMPCKNEKRITYLFEEINGKIKN